MINWCYAWGVKLILVAESEAPKLAQKLPMMLYVPETQLVYTSPHTAELTTYNVATLAKNMIEYCDHT